MHDATGATFDGYHLPRRFSESVNQHFGVLVPTLII